MGKARFLFLAALLAASPTSVCVTMAAEVLPGPFHAELLRVVDGDTFQARVRLWLGLDLVRFIRIAGIDAPEIKGKCPGETEAARAARDHLALLLGGGAVTLTDVHHGKFAGRVVATVRLPTGQDVAARLIAAGHALPAGHRRVDRCP